MLKHLSLLIDHYRVCRCQDLPFRLLTVEVLGHLVGQGTASEKEKSLLPSLVRILDMMIAEEIASGWREWGKADVSNTEAWRCGTHAIQSKYFLTDPNFVQITAGRGFSSYISSAAATRHVRMKADRQLRCAPIVLLKVVRVNVAT